MPNRANFRGLARWLGGVLHWNETGGAAASHAKDLRCVGDFYAALLAMASHDLRQPLQVILSMHTLLSQRIADGPEREYLERGELALAQVVEQFDRLIEALRIQERAGRVRVEPVAITPLFDRLYLEHAEPARRRGLDLRVQPAVCEVMSDPVLLEGIVRNLLRNALNYTPSGGRVLVGVRRRGPSRRIDVCDTGVGIEREELAHIFDAFRRSSASCPSGLGLGLFIVKRAADSLEHQLEVRTAPGHGSRFSVFVNKVGNAPHWRPVIVAGSRTASVRPRVNAASPSPAAREARRPPTSM
jgi:signal transduction histidine kinase